MKVLITGSAGFTAKYLIEKLQSCEIFMTDITNHSGTRYYRADITKREVIKDVIDEIHPDQIYHLAGSFSESYETDYLVNVISTKNVLDSIRELNLNTRVLLVGSAAEYGCVKPEDNPIKETHSLNPVSIYGLTKVFQTYMMRYYNRVFSSDIVMARPFNLMGNGMSTRLFIGNLYNQIYKYKKGIIAEIVLGNLENRRDYIDVSDAVEIYIKIMNQGSSGEVYNVGSGKPTTIVDLLKVILKNNQLDDSIVRQEINYKIGKNDVEEIYADLGKINSLQ